jgi:hypothetical protein
MALWAGKVDSRYFQESRNFSQDISVCDPFARIIESRRVDKRHREAAFVKVVVVSDLGCCRFDAMANLNRFVTGESRNKLSFHGRCQMMRAC